MLENCYRPIILSSSEEPECTPTMCMGVSQGDGGIGSAYLEIGGSKIHCVVYSPRLGSKSGSASVSLDRGELECVVQNSWAESETEEKVLANKIATALESSLLLERYPKASILVNFVIIQTGANNLMAAVDCGALALVDAGIEMKDIVTCCRVSWNRSQIKDVAVGGATAREKSGKHVESVLVAMMKSLDKATFIEFAGKSNGTTTVQMLEMARMGCQKIREEMDRVILSSI